MCRKDSKLENPEFRMRKFLQFHDRLVNIDAGGSFGIFCVT